MIRDPFSEQEVSWRTAVQPGLNRKYWSYRFPTSTASTVALKSQLTNVVQHLEGVLTSSGHKELLAQVKIDLSNATTATELNEIRGLLVEQFSGYAAGRPFFGEKLQPIMAHPGRYQVNLISKKHKTTGWLNLRADPLLNK